VRGFFRRSKTWQDYFQKGMRWGAASVFSRAEASFREAVRLAPEEPYPHYELGYTLALVGRHEEALTEFRRTEQLSRGFFLVETEISMCEQLLSGSIDVEVLEMLRSLRRLVDNGGEQTEEAVSSSQKVIELAPQCALGHFHFGNALFFSDPHAAERALRRCVELNPDDTTAINAKWHLGKLCEQSGHEDEAQQIWSAIVADYRGHPLAAFAKASQLPLQSVSRFPLLVSLTA
jgi:tetratricopeptide (TPR) repeat protein